MTSGRVQTFLPYPSFRRSAAVLDDRRLGKQRVETLQILRALHLEGYGWAHHPVVLMWRGHAGALVAYGLAMVEEWCRRGFADTTRPNIEEFTRPAPVRGAAQLSAADLPPWLGWMPLHRSHQAALVRKDPGFYRAAFPDVSADLPYVWPEPPAEPPPAGPFAAWVVRATSGSVLEDFLAGGYVGLPAHFDGERATPKQRRQLNRLRTAVPGDRVVVPDGGDLHGGVLLGPPRPLEVAGTVLVVRDVTWVGTVARSALRRPYQLQDPQLMFALREEPSVAFAA